MQPQGPCLCWRKKKEWYFHTAQHGDTSICLFGHNKYDIEVILINYESFTMDNLVRYSLSLITPPLIDPTWKQMFVSTLLPCSFSLFMPILIDIQSTTYVKHSEYDYMEAWFLSIRLNLVTEVVNHILIYIYSRLLWSNNCACVLRIS
jgi:hypothetical protein